MLNPWFRDEDDEDYPLAFFVGACNAIKITAAVGGWILFMYCIPDIADWLAGVIIRWGW